MTIYSLLGAFLFSAYIVYDVHLLIARKLHSRKYYFTFVLPYTWSWSC